MKKFLSLVLALVMTMSLVTISAGAKDFTDDDKITYEEAVAVVSEIGVVDGYADGKFNPTNTLTRQAAAKIICNLILGPTTAAELHADTAPYKDVPATSEFAGYIAYCAKEGIISGYADGSFKPGNTLTGYAFMKMLLGALGYDAETEGYTGANWSINVAKRALGIGLNSSLVGEFNGVKAVTREEAALYAFNTLKATMVEYDEQSTIVVGGATVTLSGKAQDVAWGTGTLNDGKVDKDGFVQFAEKYFPKLTRTDDIDPFGRPANKWTYNKKDIDSYVDYTKMVSEYTVKVEGGDVYSDVGSVAADYDLTYWQDGVKMPSTDAKKQATYIAKKNDDKMGASGNGVLTQIFVDNDTEDLTIVEVNTYLAETDDYNEKKETLKFNDIYGINGKNVDESKVAALALEDFPSIKDYEDGDMVLLTIANNEVQTIVDAETVSDVEITEFSKKDYVVAGEKYSYAVTGTVNANPTATEDAGDSFGVVLLDNYDNNNLDDVTFNLYLDSYGYVIGIKEVEAKTEYVFITAYDWNSSNLVNKTAEANAIFVDGTMDVINVSLTKSDFTAAGGHPWDKDGDKNLNHWYKYTVKNDVYTLTDVANQFVDTTSTEIDSKHVSLTDGAKYFYGNADTNYIVAGLDILLKEVVINDVESVTTGVKNVAIDIYTTDAQVLDAAGSKSNLDTNAGKVKGVYTLTKTSGAYVIAAVVVGDDGTVADRYAYLYGAPENEKYSKSEDVYYWDMKAVIDGAETTVTFKTDLPANDKFDEDLYKLSYDKDGYAVDADKAVHTTDYDYFWEFNPNTTDIIKHNAKGAGNAVDLTAEGDTLWVSSQTEKRGYALADECPAVIIEQNAAGAAKKIVEYTTVAKAIKALDNYGGAENFDGMLYVFFKDGVATSVILTDTITSSSNTNTGSATGAVDYVKVDLVNDQIVLDEDDKGASQAEIQAAAKAALASVGYKAVGDVITTPNTNGNWTIKAVDMESANNTQFTFEIVWG